MDTMNRLNVFSVGECADVAPESRSGRRNSEGGRAIVVRNDSAGESVRCDVQCIGVNNHLSQDVAEERTDSAVLDTTARKRKNQAAMRPSLLEDV